MPGFRMELALTYSLARLNMNNIEKILLSGAILASAGLAQPCFADPATPVVDQRQFNQERRIQQGIESGALTEHEANQLERQQDRIERHEANAKADGVVTARERASLTRQQNMASRNIARKKHNLRRQ